MGTSGYRSGRSWAIGICALVCGLMAVSALAPRGFALTAFGDILQSVVLLAATIALLVNVRAAAAKSRLFWALMGMGLAMWLGSQVMWTYVEVCLRHEAPN